MLQESVRVVCGRLLPLMNPSCAVLAPWLEHAAQVLYEVFRGVKLTHLLAAGV